MDLIIVAAITGAGLVTGLLFAFSNFALQSLADLPNDKGMFTMQRINERIINPLFLVLFFGTPILCGLIAVNSVMHFSDVGAMPTLIGAMAYLAGPFGITVLFNVPLNNQLAAAELNSADEVWPEYQQRWQRWNHIRTSIGTVAVALLAIGLGAAA
ncbi:MAG: DUF1772 domain-containing protein [Gammaproteobacteria bacterium]|nr:DUF1772 domain-containing protein [Gammaproteobacteria bacterium]